MSRRKLKLLAVAIAAVLVTTTGVLSIWHRRAGMPVNTREALGIQGTLKGVKRISKDKVQVTLLVNNTRPDWRQVGWTWEGPAVTIGDPPGKWPLPGFDPSERVGPRGKWYLLKRKFTVAPQMTHITVRHKFSLDRPNHYTEFSFRNITTRVLPVAQTKHGIEVKLVQISDRPKIDESNWEHGLSNGNWVPGRGEYFALLVHTRFPRGFRGDYRTYLFKDASGRQYSNVATYTSGGPSRKENDALSSRLNAAFTPTLPERAVRRVSPGTADTVTDWRGRRAAEKVLSGPTLPETALYVFRGKMPSGQFSVFLHATERPGPEDQAEIVFENVPIQ